MLCFAAAYMLDISTTKSMDYYLWSKIRGLFVRGPTLVDPRPLFRDQGRQTLIA